MPRGAMPGRYGLFMKRFLKRPNIVGGSFSSIVMISSFPWPVMLSGACQMNMRRSFSTSGSTGVDAVR